MAITQAELDALTARINAALAPHSADVEMSVHFGLDRINDLRNRPPITADELEGIFMRFIEQHLPAALALQDNETFNIRCLASHINMPCEVRKYVADPKHNMFVITVMRKQSFVFKERHEFRVA